MQLWSPRKHPLAAGTWQHCHQSPQIEA